GAVRRADARALAPQSDEVRPPPFAVETRHEPAGSHVRFLASKQRPAQRAQSTGPTGRGGGAARPAAISLADHLSNKSLSQPSTVFLSPVNNSSSMFAP
ncbi:unnamed protein product, partial [Heterosigma akashiwo]